MGKAGREYVERHFAREAVTALYRAGLEAVVSRE
jgi:hypothetical protein